MKDKDFIKTLRKRLGWNAERLAEFCCTTKGNVYNWECGYRKPSKTAMKLMKNVDKLI